MSRGLLSKVVSETFFWLGVVALMLLVVVLVTFLVVYSFYNTLNLDGVEISRMPSPDNHFDVIVFSDRGGAIDCAGRILYLQAKDTQSSNGWLTNQSKPSKIFSSTCIQGMRWKDARTLIIERHPCSRIYNFNPVIHFNTSSGKTIIKVKLVTASGKWIR